MTATVDVQRPPVRAIAVAAVVVASTLSLAVGASGGGWLTIVLAVWSAPVTIAAVEDAFTARLRDAVVLRGVVITFVAVVVVALVAGERVLVGGVAGGAALGGWLLIFHLAAPSGMGFGDVKFGFLLGSGIGAFAPVGVVLVGVLAVVLQVVVVGIRPLPAQRRGVVGRREAPFGPALAAAAFLVIIALTHSGVS